MRRTVVVLALASMVATAGGIGPTRAAPTAARFPSALHGSWGPHPMPCRASGAQDDVLRLTIHAGERSFGNYRDSLRSITQIAEAPLAWWAVSTSNDPFHEGGVKPQIYVLAGDTMVVTDGARADTWVRCT